LSPILGGIIATIIVLVCVMYCVVQHFQNRDLKKQYTHTINELTESNEQKILNAENLFSMIEKLGQEKSHYKDRVNQLEKSIETGFGVAMRTELTIVDTELLKFDYVAMLAGVHKLLKSSMDNIEDAEYYIDLIKKIQAILDQMPEIQEEKGASEIKNGI